MRKLYGLGNKLHNKPLKDMWPLEGWEVNEQQQLGKIKWCISLKQQKNVKSLKGGTLSEKYLIWMYLFLCDIKGPINSLKDKWVF